MNPQNDAITEILPEEKELQTILAKVQSYPKLSKWVVLFLDKDNKHKLKTYGNRTKSAIHAYGYNPDDPKEYNTAMCVGHQNYRKLQILASEYYETQGFTTGKYLDLLVSKAISTNNARYMQILGEVMDVYNPKAQLVINNTQNNQVNNATYVRADDPRIAQLNKDFQAFIEAKYNKNR